jgi:hypothetical protein
MNALVSFQVMVPTKALRANVTFVRSIRLGLLRVRRVHVEVGMVWRSGRVASRQAVADGAHHGQRVSWLVQVGHNGAGHGLVAEW